MKSGTSIDPARSGSRNARRWLALILAVVVVLSPGAMATAGKKTKKVKATATDLWKPTHLYIGKKTRVKWTNPTSEIHDLAAYGGGWSFTANLDPGETAQRKFKKKGTFKYRCVRHSGIVGGTCQGMCGFVHVFNK
jgi:plastocyanin